jgi:hypothetical protein
MSHLPLTAPRDARAHLRTCHRYSHTQEEEEEEEEEEQQACSTAIATL